MSRMLVRFSMAILACCLLGRASAQTPSKGLNPAVKKIVEAISQERIAATLRALEAFQTRNPLSEIDSPERGAGAARRWIYEQFKSYSPRLEVRYDTYRVKKKGRLFRDVELVNIVALLPGTLHKDRQFIAAGHYDSLNLVRKPATADNEASDDLPDIDPEKSAAQPQAPGVTDDGSGTAAVLEMARVMSQFEFENTIVFVSTAF
jgi:acetylornithine deacetylase/succinyl-diaminopimelate desuccinylase-like protein